MWLHPLPSWRFHVLLNSLFKVLCNFPSRYLFAIGLVLIFSLRWSLPPTLGCTRKQPDSSCNHWTPEHHHYRPDTHFGSSSPSQRDLGNGPTSSDHTKHHTSCQLKAEGFGAGLFPLHSQLLRESFLVSFPPLTDMLKFSGYSRPSWGRKRIALSTTREAHEEHYMRYLASLYHQPPWEISKHKAIPLGFEVR